jgi:hypothetical protein
MRATLGSKACRKRRPVQGPLSRFAFVGDNHALRIFAESMSSEDARTSPATFDSKKQGSRFSKFHLAAFLSTNDDPKQSKTLRDASSLTLQRDASNLMMMIGKKLFLMLLVGTLLLLQFADCMAAFSQDQQAMQCCGASACTPANQTHGCCKAMTSTEIPRMLVKARISLNVPAVAVVEHAPMHETSIFTPHFSASLDPQRYYSPELYTLHGSLLI